MRVVKFDDRAIKDEIISIMKTKRLIPIIGSGFTRGSAARNGQVPSGTEMKNDMISELNTKFPNQEHKLPQKSFSEIARMYEKHIDMSIKHRYLEKYFTQVKISDIKKEFLKIDWPYIYTLNIDDGIEWNSNYDVILPNEQLRTEYLSRNRCLFKLHGDAHHVLKYKKSDKYIFTEIQYLESLKKNVELLDLLKNDLFSLNVVYIGCSLDDELDILSVASTIENQPMSMKHTYFITHTNYDELELSNLEDFGVDTVIRVDTYDVFFREMFELYKEASKIESDELEEFKNLKCHVETSGYSENINYLFDSNRVFQEFDKCTVKFPAFKCHRDIINDIIKNINKRRIQVIYGHRISGKTYVILSLLEAIKNQDTYYFPSSTLIKDSVLTDMLHKQKTVILFDSHTLNDDQIRLISKEAHKIEKNDLNIIICVNTSDKEAMYILSSVEQDSVKITEVLNNFSRNEINELNEKLSHSDIPIFDNSKSILDNIFSIDNITKDRNRTFSTPDIDNLSREELVIMILLATQGAITSHDIVRFDLSKSIGEFHNKIEPAIQYEYTSLLEREHHSGYKVIPNAKYWVLKWLGEYSKVKAKQNAIADAYWYIALRVRSISKDNIDYSKKIDKYIKFDIINEIFPRREEGSISLINKIYDRLHDVLATIPQYFHQRAKSKLWMYRDNQSELKDALKYALKSKHDMKTLNKNGNKNLEKSISHVSFTLALIYGRITNLQNYEESEMVSRAIDAYYEALNDEENIRYVSNFLNRPKRYKDKDTADIKNLINKVLSDQSIKDGLEAEQIRKIEELTKQLQGG